ncbi:FAD-dependent oxidoreductase [uncultured Endozoicomonas sp.]|uniref:NAD(P)/FAD-dependent oxidoreductase n=1 Tax=uncultured Endozoicomonas sp. TaxID=432652 RepID=UPI002628234C|nr:FAD-dependent oxidoreductase [uncultured Endozoicomonas sp.]
MGEKPKLVVIGNGMGGVRLLEQLFAKGSCPFEVTVLSAEDSTGYNRIQLSKLLAGAIDLDGIQLKPLQWYQEQGIKLFTGEDGQVVNIDRDLKQVSTQSGKTFSYDRLVLATGSQPNRIPVPGADLKGVMSFRTLQDVNRMLEGNHQYVVVIGGGLLGLECASGLVQRGMSVTIVDNMPTPMARQLDSDAGLLLRQTLESRGIQFRSQARLKSYDGVDGHVCGVQLEGDYLPASLVIVTAGVRPDIDLMKACGLKSQRGVLVNDQLQTSDPAIMAMGECVEMQYSDQSLLFGLVAPVYRHAEIVASHLLGGSREAFVPVPIPTNLKVDGVDVFSSGEFNPAESDEVSTLHAPDSQLYRKLVINNNRIKGVLLYGDVTDGLWYQELMASSTDISPFRQQLLFGQRFLPAA